jgi:PadR family transcriptional regulator, regulatory protein PadR
MDLENTKAQMRKGVLEMCVLAMLAERETYPPEIVEQLRGTQLAIVEGTIYPLLTRLKNEGLLDYVWREGEKGPPRKYYVINNNGREVLITLTESWNQLVQAVADMLVTGTAAPPGNMPPPLQIEERP